MFDMLLRIEKLWYSETYCLFIIMLLILKMLYSSMHFNYVLWKRTQQVSATGFTNTLNKFVFIDATWQEETKIN